MAKQKKETKPCSLRMDASIFDRLEEFCQETGITKTALIEKAVVLFMDDYESKMGKQESKEAE